MGLSTTRFLVCVTSLLPLCAAASLLPSTPKRATASGAGTVQWSPASQCDPGTDCGFVIVPKDYFDPSAGTASIAIARFNATQLPKKGTVFLNPGGPGNSGTSLASPLLSTYLIGPQWDLIGFDPRGINQTSPQVQCFETASDFDTFSAHTVLEQGFTVASSTNLTNPAIEELVEQSRQFLALKQSQAELCGKNMGDELKYMGTATVVRDLDFMSKIFDGEDAKINYWGASYGSILGSYLVNMLPDRVGYVVIDGIVDPVVWSSEPSQNWPINWLQSTEKTYQFYLKTCSQAGPATCPLAKSANEPSGNILARLETLFDALALAPLPVPFGSRPGFLTSGAARALLLEYLEDPTLWGESALAFSQAMAANGTLLFNKLAAPYPGSISTPHYDLVRLGVTCLDSPPPASPSDVPTAEDLAAQLVKTLKEVSPHFGASTSVSEPDGGCQFWPVKGPERFTGPFTANLERPMLVISNTLDPITPIYSGLHVHTLMPNSTVLVIQDGPGHTSTAILTPCTLGLVQGYFAGILPDNGTVCNVTYPYFSDESGPAAASSALIELPGLEKDAPALIALLRGL